MNLRIKSTVAATVLALGIATPAFAAPLSFPDVPANHWAKDAVETLAAKHILEGYPDGTFKGDRAATRWEVAMVVARLLKQIEDGQSNFATKQDLEAIQRLANSLKDELEALGQRVTKLEGDVSKLDQRVTELERITFYGSAEARFTGQCFTNTNKGRATNNDGIGGLAVGNFVDYEHGVGTMDTANMTPLNNYGMLPVADYTRGVALTNGTGFTMKAVLGLRIRVSDDVDAGAEFAAYSQVGDSVVDALWGVSAPYSCSGFTDNATAGAGNNHNTFTRMVLDNFWVMHNPSGTKLTVGAYNEDHMDDLLFAGQPNFGAYGNQYLDRFGFDVNGSTKISDWGVFRWELLGSRMNDGARASGAALPYQTNLLGADLGLEFGAGQVKVNFMHVANESQDSQEYQLGGIDSGLLWNSQANFGTANVGNLQWVNPETYSWAWGLPEVQNGQRNLVDDRPISVENAGVGADAGFGYLGPQQMVGFSVKADYKWELGESGNTIYAAGQYGRTSYKSNKNSNYASNGNAYKIEVGTNLLDGDLDLALAYIGVDPNYDPFVNVNPIVGGVNLNAVNYLNMNQYNNMWSLHDVDEFPHNRQGITFNGQWRFDDRRGLVWAKAKFLSQTKSSLYDTRLAAGTDGYTADIMGFKPGFMDPVFYGYASPSVYGIGGNSFDPVADGNGWYQVLDGVDHKGKQTNFGIGASYKWENPRLKVDLGYEGNQFKRNVDGNLVNVNEGCSQDYVKLNNDTFHVGLGWEASDKWTIRAGCDFAQIKGHWDPAGQYNGYAQSLQDVGAVAYDFENIKVSQTIPYIGFDYDMTANTQWNLDLRYYDTKDGVDGDVWAGATTDSTAATAPGYTAHPFSWYGWQVTSQFKIKF